MVCAETAMDASGSHESNRTYYDAFATRYEARRGRNDPGGYHEMLDALEADYVRRFGTGRDVLEVGCGTGLILERIKPFAGSTKGIDLSPGMLAKAKERGFDVVEGSATDLPFDNESFDVTCSFKVLAHVKEIEQALSEMVRVTRRGGVVLAEFYNPNSLRGLVKRFGPAGAIADGANESHVYTRYDTPASIRRLLPPGTDIIDSRGVRVALPAAGMMRGPLSRRFFWKLERLLCDSPLRVFGGFWIAAIAKRS